MNKKEIDAHNERGANKYYWKEILKKEYEKLTKKKTFMTKISNKT